MFNLIMGILGLVIGFFDLVFGTKMYPEKLKFYTFFGVLNTVLGLLNLFIWYNK